MFLTILSIHSITKRITAARSNKNIVAWFLLIVMALIWGSSFILIKKGVAVFEPGQVGSLRILTASLVLLPVVIIHLRQVPKNKWKVLFFCGLLGNLLPSFLFSIAGAKLNSSVAGILNALTPLFTLIVGAVFFRLSISFAKVIGLLLGFLGCTLLIVMNASGEFSFSNYYTLLPILATLFYGINANLIKRYLSDLRPLQIAALSIGSVGPIAGFYFFSTDVPRGTLESEPGMMALSYVLMLGIIGTAFATVLFNKVIQLAGPLFTTSVTYLIPVVAVMWGVADGEKLNLIHLISMLTIIAGVYLVNKTK